MDRKTLVTTLLGATGISVVAYLAKNDMAAATRHGQLEDSIRSSELSNLEKYASHVDKLTEKISRNEKRSEWFYSMMIDVRGAIETYENTDLINNETIDVKKDVLDPFIDYVMGDIVYRIGAGGSSYNIAKTYLDALEMIVNEKGKIRLGKRIVEAKRYPERLPEILELRRQLEDAKPRDLKP